MPPAALSEFGALVDLVYQGATDPLKWREILPPMVEWIGGRRTLLFTPTLVPERGGFVFSHKVSESTIELWNTRYKDADVWTIEAVKRQRLFEGNVQLAHELVPTAQLLASNWYKDFLCREDIVHAMYGVVFGIESQTVLPVVCSVFRGIADAEFGAVEQARMRLILPHLSRAFGVMMRLRDAEFKIAASLAALDRVKSAIVLVGAGSRVVFANRAAQRVLGEEDGLRLRALPGVQSSAELVADGLDAGGSPAAQEALAAALLRSLHPDLLATAHFGKTLAVPRHSGRAPYAIQLSSLPEHNEFGTGADAPRAILFITDPAEPLAINAQLMRDAYGLTAAEIRTAGTTVQGGTVEEIAASLGISENTVRTQLKQIYAKTGVDSRARLVKLIHSLAST